VLLQVVGRCLFFCGRAEFLRRGGRCPGSVAGCSCKAGWQRCKFGTSPPRFLSHRSRSYGSDRIEAPVGGIGSAVAGADQELFGTGALGLGRASRCRHLGSCSEPHPPICDGPRLVVTTSFIARPARLWMSCTSYIGNRPSGLDCVPKFGRKPENSEFQIANEPLSIAYPRSFWLEYNLLSILNGPS
jgi:hypothetical protein